MFRADAPGNYSSGTFFTLLENFSPADVGAISLIEQDTFVGDVWLSEGSFIFGQTAGVTEDIYHFSADDVGVGTTVGTISTLIDGSEATSFNDKGISGLELIETATTIGSGAGAVTLQSGDILISLTNNGTVGSNSLSTNENDVFFFRPTETTMGPGIEPSTATATMLMQGVDVELSGGGEGVEAIAMFPTFPLFVDLDADDSVALGRDFAANFVGGAGPASIVDSDAVIDDTASGTLDSLTVTITDLLDGLSESLSADTAGTGITAVYNSGTGELSLTGTTSVANYQQVLRSITYDNAAGTPSGTSRTIDFVADDGTNLSNSATTTVMIDGVWGGSLWVSTDANVVAPGADGLPDGWLEGEVLEFAGADMQFGGATDGDLSKLIDFDPFISGTADVTSLHRVSRDLTVGSGADTFDLLTGDVLVTFAQDETILAAYYETGSDTLVHNADLLVFRADTPGDYTSGTFYMLLDDVVGNRFRGVTLVEQDTTVGGTSLSAGDFLFAQETLPSEDIYRYATTGVGAGAKTSGTITTLIDGSDLNIATAISNIDLIESTTMVGGKLLEAGSILVNLNANATVAANNLVTTVNDIFVLDVTSTGIATTAATASMFLDGSDVGIDGSGGAERLFAFTVISTEAPVATTDTYSVNEDAALDSTLTASPSVLGNDVSSESLTAYLISGPSNAASFAFNSDGSFTYTPTADFNGTDTFTYKANDGDLDSNVTTVTITVNSINDAPTIATNTGTTVLEGATGTAITTAMLNEGDIDDSGAGLTYTITNVTGNGTMYLAGFGALALNDTFTQADIDAGDVTYDHNGGETTSDAFSFSLADGGEDGSTPATGTFNFTVTPVNDAPVFTSLSTADANENQTAVMTVTTTDVDGGAQNLFDHRWCRSGTVCDRHKFRGFDVHQRAPDYESPLDVEGDNVYEVQVTADDGATGTASQSISVTVLNVVDTSFDGSSTLVWSANGNSTPLAADFNGIDFSTDINTDDIGGPWRVVAGAESPDRDEKIVVGVDASGNLSGQMWDGSAWTAFTFNDFATVSDSTKWGFAVEYESISGDAVLVWNNGTTGTTSLSYRVWDGTTWSATNTITTPLAGEAQQMRFAHDIASDEMVLIVSNAANQDYALVWDGDNWGNARNVDDHRRNQQYRGVRRLRISKRRRDGRLWR